DRARQRLGLRPLRLRVDARPRARAAGGARAPHRDGAGERQPAQPRRTLRRLQALRYRPRRRALGARGVQRAQVHRVDGIGGTMFDTIIKGGRVVDGSGLPSRIADIGIALGLIADIGRLSGARETIDADGLVMGGGASERQATADGLRRMRALVQEGMGGGAAGFWSSQAPTHVDHEGRPVPSRGASFSEVATLAEAAGERGPATIAFLAESAVQGYNAEDREGLIVLARRSGLPVIVQGMGFRPGQRA